MPLSKEEAIRLGIKIRPIQHSQKRRAVWNDYFMPGRYGVTIHVHTDEEGRIDRTQLLSQVVGSCKDRNVRVELTEVGNFVAHKIEQIGKHEHYGDVECIHSVIMPTHIHLTLEIKRQLPVTYRGGKPLQLNLGHMIGGIKGGCTSLYRHWLEGDFMDCEPNSEEWCRRCDFTYEEWKAHKPNRHLLDGNKSHPKSYLHVNEGLPSEGNVANVNDKASITSTSLWEEGYNDKILNTTRKLEEWLYYEDMNPYFWRLQDENPHLFEHRLHLGIAMREGEVMDFSAYGCMFLLRKGDRIQVQCTRLAKKGMLTPEEWNEFSRPERARQFEVDRREKSLGSWDRHWLYSRDPECKTPIPYELTSHFRKIKTDFLAMARRRVILVSPAVSAAEQDIIYSAIAEGYPVIKLMKKPFNKRNHPTNNDRLICAKGQMLLLGPWEIPHTERLSSDGSCIPEDTDYSRFHNLNDLAHRMCDEIGSMSLKGQYED